MMPRDEVAEARLTNALARASDGDPAAFDELVRWLETPLLGYALARGASYPDDVANAALVRVFHWIDEFSGDAAQFRSETFRIARNLIADLDERADDLPNRVLRVAADHVEPVGPVESALILLTPDQRDVLLLRVVAGLSIDDCVAVVDRRPSAVRALQHSALTTLCDGVAGPVQRSDDGPVEEARRSRHRRDEIDAVLGDGLVEVDLVDVAGVVYDLRLAFLRDQHLTRSLALSAFTNAPLGDDVRPLALATSAANGAGSRTAGRRRRTVKAVTAVTAGAVGKLAFGAAVAAASIGGLHAADVVDVPGLPDDAPAVVVIEAAPDDEDTGESNVVENSVGENEVVANSVGENEVGENEVDLAAISAIEQREFAVSMQAWTRCVSEAAAARNGATGDRDDGGDRSTGRFDPEADPCGPRPDRPGGRPDDVPGGRPDDVPGGRPDEPGGRPDDVPSGRPDEPGGRP